MQATKVKNYTEKEVIIIIDIKMTEFYDKNDCQLPMTLPNHMI